MGRIVIRVLCIGVGLGFYSIGWCYGFLELGKHRMDLAITTNWKGWS
jgi:hypothetical protein